MLTPLEDLSSMHLLPNMNMIFFGMQMHATFILKCSKCRLCMQQCKQWKFVQCSWNSFPFFVFFTILQLFFFFYFINQLKHALSFNLESRQHYIYSQQRWYFLHFIKGKILLALQHDPLPLMFYFDT